MVTTASLEIFPETIGSLAGNKALSAAQSLGKQNTTFVSVTCTKGNFDLTLETASQVKQLDYPTVVHMLCFNRDRDQIAKMIESCRAASIHKVIALRGDDANAAAPNQNAVSGSHELVSMLVASGNFDEIMVGGYPETHPDSDSEKADTAYLKQKINAGANRIITQFCFEPELICRFRDRCHAAGITVPISAGILPIRNFTKVCRFAKHCNTQIPPQIHSMFEGADKQQAAKLSFELLKQHTEQLLSHGFDIHYYTLNLITLLKSVWESANNQLEC